MFASDVGYIIARRSCKSMKSSVMHVQLVLNFGGIISNNNFGRLQLELQMTLQAYLLADIRLLTINNSILVASLT